MPGLFHIPERRAGGILVSPRKTRGRHPPSCHPGGSSLALSLLGERASCSCLGCRAGAGVAQNLARGGGGFGACLTAVLGHVCVLKVGVPNNERVGGRFPDSSRRSIDPSSAGSALSWADTDRPLDADPYYACSHGLAIPFRDHRAQDTERCQC